MQQREALLGRRVVAVAGPIEAAGPVPVGASPHARRLAMLATGSGPASAPSGSRETVLEPSRAQGGSREPALRPSAKEKESPDSSSGWSGREKESPDSSSGWSGRQDLSPDSSSGWSGRQNLSPDSSSGWSGREGESPDTSLGWSGRVSSEPSAAERLDTLLRTLGADTPPPPPATRIALPLPGHTHPTPYGPCFVLRTVFEPEQRHGDRPLGALATRSGADAALLAVDAGLAGFDPRTAIFLDLETTSLGHGLGNLPFLLGIAWFQGPRLVLEQWLLRDPDEEAAALYELAQRLADAEWLVTYNGRTFDAPLLASRYALHHLPDVIPAGHLDLLPISRRQLKHGLPNCRLGTVEAHHLGLRRVGDVTGSQVPAAWIEHQHGGAPHALVGVVRHNRDDILSLVTLLDLLLARAEAAESLMLRDPPAALALAAAALKLGHWARAEGLYAQAAAFPGTAEVGRKGLLKVARGRKRALSALAGP